MLKKGARGCPGLALSWSESNHGDAWCCCCPHCSTSLHKVGSPLVLKSLDLVLLRVKFISKMPGYGWCAFCLIVFHLQLSKKVFVASRLISAFRDKLERQTPGNAYLERWILSWEVIFVFEKILRGDFHREGQRHAIIFSQYPGMGGK